jgi:Mn2+/Fe2+ NRAMP family transporter
MRRPPPPSQGSLFAAIVRTVSSHEPNARLQKIDVALGFIAFFVLFAVVKTAASTLQGTPSAVEALVAALFVGLGYTLLRRRDALCRRIAENKESNRQWQV